MFITIVAIFIFRVILQTIHRKKLL